LFLSCIIVASRCFISRMRRICIPPQISRPDYKRWYYYCSKCGTAIIKRINALAVEQRQERGVGRTGKGTARDKLRMRKASEICR